MTKIKNVPEFVPLDDESVFFLSVARAWLDVFPPTLRLYGRLRPHRLHHAMETRQISPYGLLSAAYFGVAPLPSSYGRFMTQVERVNKLEPHAESAAFRKDAIARENSAASEFGMSRGELKRLLERLDTLATTFAGVASYDAIINCKQEILQDQSPFAPADRETYAEGPLHLWDFAKTAAAMKLADTFFGTFSSWILFVHLEDGVVFGHAIHPRAHRFGNFARDPVIELSDVLMPTDAVSPVIQVSSDVQQAVKALADRHLPDQPFEFIPPPMTGGGLVIPSKMIHPDQLRRWTEV